MEFQCSGCGACCKRMTVIKENAEALNFPYQIDNNGRCEMLDENDKCKVYDNRPDICNVEKMYDKIMSKLGMTRKEWYIKNTEFCNKFITEDNLDSKYLLNKDIYN